MDQFESSQGSVAPRKATSPAVTVILIILGVLDIAVSVVWIIMGIAMMSMGDLEIGISIFLTLTGVISVAGGVALILLPRRTAAQGSQRIMAGPEVVRSYPGVAVGVPFPTPTPTTMNQAPSTDELTGNVPTTRAAQPTSEAAESMVNLIMRSDDVFATLKDLTRHELNTPSPKHLHLAEMLSTTGLLDWEDSPTCGAGRLTRTKHFWIRRGGDGMNAGDYDHLITAEAALNLDQDLGDQYANASIDAARPATLDLLRRITEQTIEPYDFEKTLGEAYPGTSYGDTPGEWFVRTSFTSDAECVVTPFRVVYDYRFNVTTGMLVVSLEVVRPRCMAIFTPVAQEQVSLARAYALRVATLLARCAFDRSDKVQTVVVNCHEHDSVDTILSVRYTRELIARLSQVINLEGIEGNGFPADEAIRTNFGPDGWFAQVSPFLTFTSEEVSPSWRFVYPELDHRETSDAVRAVTGARRVDELGINENAGRLAARDSLSEISWDTTQDAVAALVEMRNNADDITVAEGCNHAVEALLSGSVDAQDRSTILEMIAGGTTLEKAVQRSEAALDQSDNEADPEQAVQILSEALAPIESLGAYYDDSDAIYRYFGSVAERIRFNLDVDDHRRTVRLVPDAYYNALSNLSIAYTALENYEQAMRYADEMLRIAPTSIHATMRKVRILENQSRIYEAADLIKGVLRYASTPRDAAICHYRLAFMEWKLGRGDLAVACYQRALTWDTEMSPQSREELDDLLDANKELKRFSEDEVAALLAKEGIPLGCDESDNRRTRIAATLTCDEGIFWVARPLVGILFGTNGDDVMMGVYRSLER